MPHFYSLYKTTNLHSCYYLLHVLRWIIYLNMASRLVIYKLNENVLQAKFRTERYLAYIDLGYKISHIQYRDSEIACRRSISPLCVTWKLSWKRFNDLMILVSSVLFKTEELARALMAVHCDFVYNPLMLGKYGTVLKQ